MLVYFPKLKEQLDVRVVDFQRPRAEVVALLGEENQCCPSLILADPSKATSLNLPVKEAGGLWFMDDDKAIGLYLSQVYGVSRPAHD